MIRGFWPAVGGMMARETKQDIIANNLANAATAGYKRRLVSIKSESQSFDSVLEKMTSAQRPPAAAVAVPFFQDYRDNQAGPITHTGNKLDLAISGDGWFVVGEGKASTLTRNGSFAVDSEGELVTSDGETVMGRNGAIKVPDGKWDIDRSGNIVSNGQTVDTIRVVKKAANGALVDSDAEVRQGELEMSNVNTVTEMVDLISNMRAYEANQKVIQSIDQTFDKLINEAGK